jgi:hypothetical protein
MRKDGKQEKTKKPYEKPRLRIIELAAEEVLAVGCKTAGTGAFGLPTCRARPCVNTGS